MAPTAKAHKFAGLLPEMLVRRVRERRCVLFAGAGLSAQAMAKDGSRIPTWRSLLEKMIDWCVEHRVQLRGEPQQFLDIIKKGRLLVVAQELQQSLGAQLNPCLAEALYASNAKPSEAHRLLSRIPWVAVLTSNYDGLVEGAYAVESEGIVPPVYSSEGVNQAIDYLRNGRFFVFKIHGDVNIPGSIVLGNRDYSRLLYMSPAYRSFLETLFATYTVLFIGFGASDPDLDGIVDRLSAIFERSIGQHFILTSEEEFSAIERLRLLEDKRLDCITYKADSTHSQVTEFLRALTIRAAEEKEVPTPFKGPAKKPRAFVSGSYEQLPLLRRIAEVASRIGFDVWFADRQIAIGDTIVDRISKAIDEADCLIVVMSEQAVRSSWVNFEVGRAWGARKKIFPIRIGDSAVPSDLAGFLYMQVNGPELSPEDEANLEHNLQRFRATLQDS